MGITYKKLALLSSFAAAAFFLSLNGRFEENKHKINFDHMFPLSKVEKFKQETIMIAAVVCSKGGNTDTREEAAVMIKSTIISWHLYHFNADLEFHLFLEHKEDEYFFRSKIKEYRYPNMTLNVRLLFHSALDTVSVKYRNEMNFDERFRCMYVRHFFPDALSDVDSVLYLDTDVIITGNLSVLWNNFEKMSGEQLIGAVQDNIRDIDMLNPFFIDVPFPPPKGINAGVALMNLTRMREYGFVEKVLRAYSDYTHFVKEMNDQKLLNILLYYDQGLLYEVPCQFNIWLLFCEKISLCPDAEMDPDGVQVIHGTGYQFSENHYLHRLFNHYRKVNITGPQQDWQRDLIDPIRKSYTVDDQYQCNKVFVKLLFKSISPI